MAAAIISAAAYGLQDFLGGYATRTCPVDVTVLVCQLVALPLVVVAATAGASPPTVGAAGWGAAAGLSAAFGLRVFYRALAAGPMAVVAPTSAVLSAAVPVATGLTAGHPATPAAAVGGAAALVAVVLLAGTRPTGPATADGLAMAIVAGVAFGTANVLLGLAGSAGGLWPVVAMIAVTAAVVTVGLWRLPRHAAQLPPGATRALAAATAAGLAQAIAAVGTLLAVRGNLITVGPLLALYPAATVLLAVTVTRERVSLPRVCGLATAGLAVVALSRA